MLIPYVKQSLKYSGNFSANSNKKCHIRWWLNVTLTHLPTFLHSEHGKPVIKKKRIANLIPITENLNIGVI